MSSTFKVGQRLTVHRTGSWPADEPQGPPRDVCPPRQDGRGARSSPARTTGSEMLVPVGALVMSLEHATTLKAKRDLVVGDVVVVYGAARLTPPHTVTEVRRTSYGPHLIVTDRGAGWPCAGGLGSKTVEVLS